MPSILCFRLRWASGKVQRYWLKDGIRNFLCQDYFIVKSGVREQCRSLRMRVAYLSMRILWNEYSHKTLNPFVFPRSASTSKLVSGHICYREEVNEVGELTQQPTLFQYIILLAFNIALVLSALDSSSWCNRSISYSRNVAQSHSSSI